MTPRINVTLTPQIKDEAVILAKSMGLSLSSLVRFLISEKLENRKLQAVDKILSDTDGDTHCSSDEFLAELDQMIKNA